MLHLLLRRGSVIEPCKARDGSRFGNSGRKAAKLGQFHGTQVPTACLMLSEKFVTRSPATGKFARRSAHERHSFDRGSGCRGGADTPFLERGNRRRVRGHGRY